MESPQLQFIIFVDISVMAHWQIPMFVEFLQLQYIDRVIDVCVQLQQVGCRRGEFGRVPTIAMLMLNTLLTCLSLL